MKTSYASVDRIASKLSEFRHEIEHAQGNGSLQGHVGIMDAIIRCIRFDCVWFK